MTMRRALLFLPTIAIALLVASLSAEADSTSMFDPGVARDAFTAIQAKIGPTAKVVDLRITPTDLDVEFAGEPGETETWRISRKGFLNALGLEIPRRVNGSSSHVDPISESVFPLDAAAIAVVPKLALAAIARARTQSPGKVTDMELRRLPKILTGGATEPIWQVHVKAGEEDADFGAKLSGEITSADLSRTYRARHLDLLAGGPDLDEMLADIRRQIKDDWIFHYIEIDKDAIQFDVHLKSVKTPTITRFTATLGGVKTSAFSMAHAAFPGTPPDPPFNLAEVDFSVLRGVEAAAIKTLDIANDAVERVTIAKAHHENVDALEWVVSVKDSHAPLFVMPGQPEPLQGEVRFDVKGKLLRAKYPPGHGPQIHLLQPDDLATALADIAQRLGAHEQILELRISDDNIQIQAADPRAPAELALFNYRDGDVTREPEAFQVAADTPGAQPNWRWDLALLDAQTARRIGEMEKRVLADHKGAQASIDEITISKDKLFHPENDKVLVEIRPKVAGEDPDDVTLDLSGASPALDEAKSGLFVGGKAVVESASDADEEDCTHSLDPATVIATCTRLIAATPNDTAHNRAVAYYDRGNGYKNAKQYDLALADYSAALKLDPKYQHAYVNRAFVYAAKNDAPHAIEDGTHAVTLDPSDTMAYFNRGLAYQGSKNFDASSADFSVVVAREPNNAEAFNYRGWNAYGKGDLDRALADFNKAIEIAPTFANALNLRGVIYRERDDFAKAIADHTTAILIAPQFAAAYFNRALERYASGAEAAALADATQAGALNPGDAYGAIFVDMLSRRAGLPSSLEKASAKLDMTKWPAPLVRMLLGQISPEAVTATIDDAPADARVGRSCEAHFYIGLVDLRAGRVDEAGRLFATAANECPNDFYEKVYAKREAKLLTSASAAKP